MEQPRGHFMRSRRDLRHPSEPGNAVNSESQQSLNTAASPPRRSTRAHPQDAPRFADTSSVDERSSLFPEPLSLLSSPPSLFPEPASPLLSSQTTNRGQPATPRHRSSRRSLFRNNRLHSVPPNPPQHENDPPSLILNNSDDSESLSGAGSSDTFENPPALRPTGLSERPQHQHQPNTTGYAPSLAVRLQEPADDPGIGDWQDADFASFGSNINALETWSRPHMHGGWPRSSLDVVTHKAKFEIGSPKRSREKFEAVDSKDVVNALASKQAVTVLMYRNGTPDPRADNIWPNLRDASKIPARYCVVDKNLTKQSENGPDRRAPKVLKTAFHSDVVTKTLPNATSSARGRPRWKLPVELIEMIAGHLNRDDIKSLRLVSRELNQNISQVLFKTVVVPFNTEIYGMLGNEQALDIKGKRKAGASSFLWKNANGDEIYNGHGLNVFRGFGSHILKFGMSFEVTEDALAKPPMKILTERHQSFWGTFDWPFVEYRRFEDVAGLESAADETPRMKTAFSELSKVQELALSVDAGLGWLNGPDRSIRARILQRPPEVFGTRKEIPDRRTHAQQELWRYIVDQHDGEELTMSTLYKLEAARDPSDTLEDSLALEDQPEPPFVEPRVIAEALPIDTADLPVPMSFEDPEILDRFVRPSTPSSSGILFTSEIQPLDAGQLISSVIPSTLTKAQKEWLMETEWAQRAFVSSYMLSIIDNPATFHLVHTLNISRLSDRYVSLLNRQDFWAALPNLSNVTLMVLPSWRTIHKDEAGSVDTPKINPSSEVDSVVAMLRRIVSERPKVTTLTVGWATGGEHAEGLHARNKLLQPAPLLGLDMVTSQTPAALRLALLQLPFVERLTLKNCWMTPMALQEFVKLHDNLSLKHLVLDSFSLTGILRPPQNIPVPAQPPNNIGGNPWVPGLAQAQALHAHTLATQSNGQGQQQNILGPIQFFQAQFQLLQIQLHQLQNGQGGGNALQIQAVQAQLQQLTTNGPAPPNQGNNGHANQLQVQGTLMNMVHQILQNHGHLQQGQPVQQAPPVAVAVPQPSATNQTLLRAEPREGSWVNVIDVITPGPNLRDLGSEYSQADQDRKTSLKTIEFISCGYARLPYSSLDQGAIDDATGGRRRTDPIFTKRAQTLLPAMLSAKWPLLGEIVQDTSDEELATLSAGWHMETGWDNEDEAAAAEFDGQLPAGTGRFTGIVRAEDRVEEATTNVDKCTTMLRRLFLDVD